MEKTNNYDSGLEDEDQEAGEGATMIKHLRVSLGSFAIAIIALVFLCREMSVNLYIVIPSLLMILAGIVFWKMIFLGYFKPVDYFIGRIRRRMEHQR